MTIQATLLTSYESADIQTRLWEVDQALTGTNGAELAEASRFVRDNGLRLRRRNAAAEASARVFAYRNFR